MLYQQETSKCPVPNDFLTRSEGYRSWPLRSHNPKVAGSNPAPATMNDEGLADVEAANPFRLPRLHPGIGSSRSFYGRPRRRAVEAAEVVSLAAAVVENGLAAVGVPHGREPCGDFGDGGVPADLLE